MLFIEGMLVKSGGQVDMIEVHKNTTWISRSSNSPPSNYLTYTCYRPDISLDLFEKAVLRPKPLLSLPCPFSWPCIHPQPRINTSTT